MTKLVNTCIDEIKFNEYFCCCSVVSDSVTPWTAAHQASLPLTISWSLLFGNEFTS